MNVHAYGNYCSSRTWTCHSLPMTAWSIPDYQSRVISHWLYIFVAAYLHLNLCSGLQKTHVFCNRVRLGRSRSSKVHDSGTNRKHVCDFLFVPIVNILHRFWDTSTYWLTRNTLDCDQSNVYSSRVVFSAISQDLPFRSSSSLYRRSASGDSPLWNKFQIFVIID